MIVYITRQETFHDYEVFSKREDAIKYLMKGYDYKISEKKWDKHDGSIGCAELVMPVKHIHQIGGRIWKYDIKGYEVGDSIDVIRLSSGVSDYYEESNGVNVTRYRQQDTLFYNTKRNDKYSYIWDRDSYYWDYREFLDVGSLMIGDIKDNKFCRQIMLKSGSTSFSLRQKYRDHSVRFDILVPTEQIDEVEWSLLDCPVMKKKPSNSIGSFIYSQCVIQ